MLMDFAAPNGLTVRSGHCKGTLIHPDNEETQHTKFIVDLLDVTKGTVPFASVPVFGRGAAQTWVLWERGAVILTMTPGHRYEVVFYTYAEEDYIKIASTIGCYLHPIDVRNPIYALTYGDRGMELSEVGQVNLELETKNYSPDAVADFLGVLNDMVSDDPIGRLTIIQGKPGTGKTFFLRGIIDSCPDSVFLLVPPGMVEGIAGPDLIPMLARARAEMGAEHPIVLVVEDADATLISRQSEHGANLGALSSLLNATDGMLGRSLNLRVICTTNAEIDNIDDALLRPGRLSRHVHLGPLDPDQAAEVYYRLSEGDEAEFNDSVTLSTIYDFVRMNQRQEDQEWD